VLPAAKAYKIVGEQRCDHPDDSRNGKAGPDEKCRSASLTDAECQGDCLPHTACQGKRLLGAVYHGEARPGDPCHSEPPRDGAGDGICHLAAVHVLRSQSVNANVFQMQLVKANVLQT